MTQYMFSVIHPETDYDNVPDNIDELYATVDTFNKELEAAGMWVFGGGLERPSTATTVRGHQGETLITDGPYLESKEYLGGFWVIEAPDLDEALKWAERASAACQNAIEVRPFQGE
jgi:hypothetical protein